MRFFLTEEQVKDGKAYINGSDAHHIATVLRQQPGEEIFLVWREMGYRGRILAVTPQTVTVAFEEQLLEHRESSLQLYLLQGLAKGERMELVIQKAVELGVKAIIPVQCRYSVVQLTGKKAVERCQRWQKIAESAAKQCGRLVIPEILPIANFSQALEQVPADANIIMPWEKETEISLAQVLQQPAPAKAALFIGPEGGFSLEEAALARQRGASLVTLGERILRTETAAIATLAIMMHRWGDLGVG